MEEKVGISVVIIAKNEEAQIADCVKSAVWAKEVLVVDDFSTDNTASIAKDCGAKVLQRGMDIEGRHRNWAYSQAQCDWVFSLDADERITEELAQNLCELVKGEPEHKGYNVAIKGYIGDYWIAHGGWYPGYKLRFFDRRHFKYEEAEVHPRVFLDGSFGFVKGDVLHYSYRGFADFVNSVNAQTTLEAKKWFKENRKIGFGKCIWKSVDRFLRGYLRKKGYKDGFTGFMVAYFAGLYQILSYAKYWELKRNNTQ